jgi:hypothetical protein
MLLLNLNQDDDDLVEEGFLFDAADVEEPFDMMEEDDAIPPGDDAMDDPADGGVNDLDALRLQGQRLHQFDELEHLFDDVGRDIEWGGEDYDHDDSNPTEDLV